MIQMIGECILIFALILLFVSFLGELYAINHCVSEIPEKVFAWIGIAGCAVFILGIFLIIRGEV